MPYSIADKTKYPELAVIEPIQDVEGLSDGTRAIATGAVFAALALVKTKIKEAPRLDPRIVAAIDEANGVFPPRSMKQHAIDEQWEQLNQRLQGMNLGDVVIEQVQAKFRAHCEKQIGAGAARSA